MDKLKIRKLYYKFWGRFKNNPFTPEMIKKKILFIHIPKTGGTSIATALFGKPKGHPYLYEYYYANKKYTKEFFKVCVVRNPFDRLVSTYFYIINGESPDRYNELFKKLNINSFEDFIHRLSNKRTLKILMKEITHIRSQHELISCGDVQMDRIYKFEDFEFIQEDLKQITGKDLLIDKLNMSKRKDYKMYYNDFSIEIVKELYKKDLHYFNYTY